MTDKTQPTAHAEITAPISADLRGMPGLSEQDAELLEQAASMLEGLQNDERNRGNCSTAEGAACSAHAVRRLAVQLLRAAPPAPAAVAVPDEQYQAQMAAISTAAIGYWKEGDAIHPDYDTVALHDVAKLYVKYSLLFNALAAAPAQAQDDRAAFKAYLQECDDCEIVPDVAGAFHAAWQKRAAPAQAVAVPDLDMDRVLSIADVHAEESREDGTRLLDRGGLVAFAKDVLRVAAPAQEHATQLAGQALPADEFRGDTASLVRNITALLDLDAQGCLVPHGVGGHARGLLSAAASRLAAPALEAPAAPADLTMTPAEIDSISSAWIYPGQQVGLASVREIVQAVLRRLRGVAEIRASVASRALAAAPQTPAAPVAWLPYLSDRADGVQGHYAIARHNPAGYREVWNLRSHRWASASDEVLTHDEALAILRKLEMPTAPAAPAQAQEDARDAMWVRADVNLPGEQGQDSEEVLLFLNGDCAMTDFEARRGGGWGIRLGYFDAEKQAFRVHGRPDSFVTHWMPLPPSPAIDAARAAQGGAL